MGAKVKVLLDDEMDKSLRQYLFDLTKETINEARKAAGLDKEFLKKGDMAKWVGVSWNTFDSWCKQGVPVSIIEGVALYSKNEVTKWIIAHQQ